MGKIDTSGWKEFRVGELFEVKISKSVDKGGLEFAEDGEYDFIGRTPLNNGIQGKLNKLKFEANQEGTYSIAQIGMHVCQYRERKWYASQNLFVLTPFTEKSHKANKFIATVITRYLDCAYGEDTYATYPTVKTLPLLKIKLPVDKTGQPDWAYMESYIANLETKVAESLTLLQAAKDAEKKKVDTREWGEFRVGELFDAERGKVKNIQPLTPGATPIIAAGAYNQGIAGMYEIDSAYKNRITVSCNGAGCGSTFYHPYEFNVNGDAITLIEKKCMPDRAKQFVACILNATFTRKFSYEEKCSPQKALAEVMRLPIDKTGQPDWAYMEEYMRKVERKTEGMLNQFVST